MASYIRYFYYKINPIRPYKKYTCFPLAKIYESDARADFFKTSLSGHLNAAKLILSNGKVRILDQLTFAQERVTSWTTYTKNGNGNNFIIIHN